ncbi:MAG TPA: hypothetical protein VIV15_08025 [Anaerolineales bacterium]
MEGKSIELLCGLHPHPGKGVAAEGIGIQLRGSLAGLGSAAYISLSALGMEQVILRMDAFTGCRWAALQSQIEHQARTAADFLEAWGRRDQLVSIKNVEKPVERPFWNAKNPPLSRRDLFRMLGRQGQMAMARAMEKEDTGLEKQPGRERRRLLSAFAHLPSPEPFPGLRLEGFAMVKVSEACTACGACDKGCPAGALHFEKNEEAKTFSLSFSPQACIDCCLCEGFCVPAAIKVESAPTFEQVFGSGEPVLLQSGKLVRCEHCRSWMSERPGRKFCDLCEFRRTNPFGSVMPPGFKPRAAGKKGLPV